MSDSKKTEGTPEGAEAGTTKDDGPNDQDKSGRGKSSSDMDMASLSAYLAQSMGIREKPASKLDEMTLKGIANYLKSDQCQNIVTMVGAGISTSAGIPDFRSPGTGLYDNLASYNLPTPQAIFDISFFREQPKPFFVLAKELLPGSFKPTVCHYFIKMLADKGKLLRHYTQNIDTLERVTGLDPDKLVEAHGTFHTSHCLKCSKAFSFPWMKEEILADIIPNCDEKDCDGVVKPDIVFFGESLPVRFATCVSQDFPKCDLLVIMGTSLQVQPFASLANRVPLATPRLYINLESGSTCNDPITALFFGGGFQFDAEDNYRDIFKQATCDDGCQELADLIGWGDDLKQIVKTEHERIDKETKSKSPEAATATESTAKSTKASGTKTKSTSNTSASPTSTSSPSKTKSPTKKNLKKKL